MLAAIAHVTICALRTAWWVKWYVTLRIRPEVMAQRIELASNEPGLRAAVPGLQAMFDAISVVPDLLDLVRKDNLRRVGEESLFLAGQFPEGSPTHPSLPSGHAVVAGACVTVLKAMLITFEDNDPTRPIKWIDDKGRQAVYGSADGTRLLKYEGADASEMTVIGELNKLASNVALGRNWAGVHYRADADQGIMIGEQVALAYLQDKLRENREDEMGLMSTELGGRWMLQKFDGSIVTITQQSVASPSASEPERASKAAAASGDGGGGTGGGGGGEGGSASGPSGTTLWGGIVQDYLFLLILGPVVLLLLWLVIWLKYRTVNKSTHERRRKGDEAPPRRSPGIRQSDLPSGSTPQGVSAGVEISGLDPPGAQGERLRRRSRNVENGAEHDGVASTVVVIAPGGEALHRPTMWPF